MDLDFDDPDTEVLVRQLASHLRVSPVAAIKLAVRNELARLEAIEAPSSGRPGDFASDPKSPAIDKDAFNELNEDS